MVWNWPALAQPGVRIGPNGSRGPPAAAGRPARAAFPVGSGPGGNRPFFLGGARGSTNIRAPAAMRGRSWPLAARKQPRAWHIVSSGARLGLGLEPFETLPGLGLGPFETPPGLGLLGALPVGFGFTRKRPGWQAGTRVTRVPGKPGLGFFFVFVYQGTFSPVTTPMNPPPPRGPAPDRLPGPSFLYLLYRLYPLYIFHIAYILYIFYIAL